MTTENAALGGVLISPTLPDETFYGFRLNPLTGALCVEVVGDEMDGVIRLPQEGVADANDYRQWIWTTNTLDFRFSEAGHLEMRVM